MPLSASQRRYLRRLAHHLHPVVTVADKGLTGTVMAEIEAALKRHELIKVRFRAERDTRRQWTVEIERKCQAQNVQSIGRVASFYRRNATKPKIALPGAG